MSLLKSREIRVVLEKTADLYLKEAGYTTKGEKRKTGEPKPKTPPKTVKTNPKPKK